MKSLQACDCTLLSSDEMFTASIWQRLPRYSSETSPVSVPSPPPPTCSAPGFCRTCCSGSAQPSLLIFPSPLTASYSFTGYILLFPDSHVQLFSFPLFKPVKRLPLTSVITIAIALLFQPKSMFFFFVSLSPSMFMQHHICFFFSFLLTTLTTDLLLRSSCSYLVKSTNVAVKTLSG